MSTLSELSSDFTNSYQYELSAENLNQHEVIWAMENTIPFDELILCWNGRRPKKGKWTFFIRVRKKEWSPWIRYAEWSLHSQKTFGYSEKGIFAEARQGIVYPRDGQCDAMHVRVVAEEGADLTELTSLYLCLSTLSNLSVGVPTAFLESILLPNAFRRSKTHQPLSEVADLCSPTATIAAINYLLGEQKLDPISFAAKVYDDTFDIYGNWILNVAQGYVELGGAFRCRVERFPSFAALHKHLSHNLPVVASIRGPLPGAPHPFTFGHLICIVGYQAERQEVLCIDSSNSEEECVMTAYPLKDFLEAWGRRSNLAYLFTPKKLSSTLERIIAQGSSK